MEPRLKAEREIFGGRPEVLFRELRRRIVSGALRVGERLPTTVELSREYGVSKDTVSRAMVRLKASGLVVTRRGVGAVVSGHSGARQIGVYLPMLKKEGEMLDPAVSPIWFQLFTGIASEAEARGYTVSVIPDTGEPLSGQLRGRDLCGVLVPCREARVCEALLRDGMPEGMRCLFMGLPFGMSGLDYSDELGDSSVERMIGELLGRGFRRLAVLGTASPDYTNRAIWRGYRAAMEASGAYSPRYEKPLVERSSAWEYEAAVRELLALPEPPEVLVVFRERFLDGVMAALSALGARVPEDVSVALVENVGNYPSSKAAGVERFSGPRLPGKAEAGRVAVRRLLELVEGRCEQVHEDGVWIWHEGETLAPPKGARRRSRQR